MPARLTPASFAVPAASLALAIAPVCLAQNLAENPGFETGTLSGWTASGNVQAALNVQPTTPPTLLGGTGQYVAVFGAGDAAPTGVLTQVVPTLTGGIYAFEFDYAAWSATSSNTPLGVRVEVIGPDSVGTLLSVTLSDQASNPSTFNRFSTEIFSQGTSLTIRFSDAATNQTIAGDVLIDQVSLFVVVAPCVGDSNGDRSVTFDDLTTTLASFGDVVFPFDPGDADGSGRVDFDDLTTVLANFGNRCPI